MKIVAIGRTEILFEAAVHIIESSRHTLKAIITAPARPEYKKTEQDFYSLGRSHNIPVALSSEIDEEVVRIIKEAGADIAVSVNWVSLLNLNVIKLFPLGIVNAHMGDLPGYKGNAVTNWALLAGEPSIAFTLHYMKPGEIDSGDILMQKRMELSGATTIADINVFALESIPEMFIKTLDAIERGSAEAIPQTQRALAPFRCYPRLPRDGKIDWTAPATRIDALVRSLVKPYSGAYTYYRCENGILRKLYIWESEVVCETTEDVGVPGHVIKNDKATCASWIYTGSGVIALKLVSHGESGQSFRPGEKWKTIRMRLGMDIEEEIYSLIEPKND